MNKTTEAFWLLIRLQKKKINTVFDQLRIKRVEFNITNEL